MSKGKTSATKKSSTATKLEAQAKRESVAAYKRQIGSIILFAAAVLFMCLVCIKNEEAWLWNSVHNIFLGVFGVCAFVWPVLLAAVSVLYALNKLFGSLISKVIMVGAVIVLIGALIDIFSPSPEFTGFGDYISICYNNGVSIKGGGALGGILGYCLYSSCGKSGAAIILIILIFVILMLVTGTTLIAFFKAIYITVTDPAKKIGKAAEVAFIERHEKNAEQDDNADNGEHKSVFKRSKKVDVDISVDDIPEKRNLVEQDLSDIQRRVIASYRDEEFDDGESDGSKASIDVDDAVIAAKKETGRKSAKTTAETKTPIVSSGIEIKQEGYNYPPLELLKAPNFENSKNMGADLDATAEHLVETLRSFGVETKIVNISRGPAVTRYELQPCAGVRINRITNLADDIALNLAAAGVRIEAPIPNRSAVGIEVPNKNTSTVGIREIVDSAPFRNSKSKLTIALGKDIAGQVVVADIAKMPHGLIAGATGSGKSVCINSIIMSILYKASPDEVKLLMIDPKVVELGIYNGIPHLLVPVVTDPRKAAGALGWAVSEMEKRYKIFAENSVRDLDGYNRLADEKTDIARMPQIVIIIDELADLMMTAPNEVEDSIVRIAQKARAAGMHLIIATQRPSVDVVTGLIKANVPSRVAFAVSSQVDSRTILDAGGAEKLLGRGDMLFYPVGANKPNRVQGCFVSDDEVERVVNYVKNSGVEAHEYDDAVMEEIERKAVLDKKSKGVQQNDSADDDTDSMFNAAVECVLEAGQASTSMLQRRLKLGYARAARIVDQMAEKGIVGPYEGSKPRQILITKAQWMERCASVSDEPVQEKFDF